MKRPIRRCAAWLLNGTRRCRSFAETLVHSDGERIQLPTCRVHGSARFGFKGSVKSASRLGLSDDQLQILEAAGRKWWLLWQISRAWPKSADLPYRQGPSSDQLRGVYHRLMDKLPRACTEGYFAEEAPAAHRRLHEALALAVREELEPDLAKIDTAIEEADRLPAQARGRVLRFRPRE